MLDVALKFLVKELNAYLAARTGSDFGKAELARVADDAGKYLLPDEQLGVTLIHLEEERVVRAQLPETRWQGGVQVVVQPPLKLNLHVLFTARFSQYDQSLRYLSHLLTFFQAHPGFTSEAHPGLDPRIDRLTLELQTLGYEQVNQIWAFLGAKQLPSVVYKVRMVLLQDAAPSSVGAPITSLTGEVRSA